MFVGVSDHQVHAGQSSNFVGRPLRVTSCDYDSGLGILAAHSADGGARVLVRSGRDGAGIEHYDRGLSGARSTSQPVLFELAFESGAIGLRGATTKILYKKSGHNVW